MTTNEELVRRLFDAFTRGELDALHETLHPEVEIYDHDMPDARAVYRGHDGFDRWTTENAEGYGDFEVEVEDVVEVGDGRLIAMVKLTARGTGSGIELERKDGAIWGFRDSLIARIEWYNDQNEALRAAADER